MMFGEFPLNSPSFYLAFFTEHRAKANLSAAFEASGAWNMGQFHQRHQFHQWDIEIVMFIFTSPVNMMIKMASKWHIYICMVYWWIDSLVISYMANWKMAHRKFVDLPNLKMLIKPFGVGLPEDILGDDSMIWPIMDFGEIIPSIMATVWWFGTFFIFPYIGNGTPTG